MADNFLINFDQTSNKLNEFNVKLGDFDTACKNGKGQKGALYKCTAASKPLQVQMKFMEKTLYDYTDNPSGSNISKKERESRIAKIEKLIAKWKIASSAYDSAQNR